MKKIGKHQGSQLLFILVLTSIITVACSPSEHAALPVTSKEITQSIDSSRWIFTPISVSPQYGRSQPVNGNYSVTYSKGKLIVYLPYFGRAFTAVDYGSSKSPLDFTSIDFGENKSQGKGDRWDIVIKPRDYKEVESMNFTFYSNGNANLDIVLASRSGIRFMGKLAPLTDQ
ncbi:MAG: DUF4251 domain-containing protein [Bacteroidota bacterium]